MLSCVILEKPAACSAVWPGISSSACWNCITQKMRNSVVKVSFQIARHQRDTAKNVFHWADIECWKLGGRPLVQHGNAIPLHAAVRGERYWFICAEEHQRNLCMRGLVFHLSSEAQAARKKQFRSCKPNIITASHIKNQSKDRNLRRAPSGKDKGQPGTMCTAENRTSYKKFYTISYMIFHISYIAKYRIQYRMCVWGGITRMAS